MSDLDPAFQQALERAQREEVESLREAVDLLQSHASRDRVEAAYKRCELARARKNELLRRAGKLPLL
ncbi:hypothetical protein [Ramlibacter sp. AN1133]|uniref:hypothetical protein n=1 Tax=Ramlibacter sp. AN1133 TaxID=3133429 RepID=UPI0030BBD1EF